FTILTFLLVDIQRSFTVDKALAGALGTITLIFRVAGGIGAGTAADRWGRKGPLMFSILWYSIFSFLGGFSTSYRMLFAIRALFVLFIMKGVTESPVWLDRQRHLNERKQRDTLSLTRLFRPDLVWTTVHTSVLMGAFLFMYHSITYWYPTLLTQMHRPTLPFLASLNIGGIVGAVACGRMSEGALGRRGAATIATLIGIVVIPL